MEKFFLRAALAMGFLCLLACGPKNQNPVNDQNPDIPENALDITDAFRTVTSGFCGDHIGSYTATATGAGSGNVFYSDVTITQGTSTCTIHTNAIPNYNFDDGAFHSPVSYQDLSFEIYNDPQMATATTGLTLTTYDAVLLNGVVVDLLSAGCYGVGDGMIGCNDVNTPYRADPGSPLNQFGVDGHNAHTQPDGTYHYHGDPGALYDPNDASKISPVIGFAADGFPIYGPYANMGGVIRKVTSSYVLKTGARPSGPGGAYDGKYIDDYQYQLGAGDLDECNGMTVAGQYGYYVTSGYPYILKCFLGTPHASFEKGRP